MRRRRLLWQLYPWYLAVLLAALAGVTWYASRTLKEFYLRETGATLEARARLVAQQALQSLGAGDMSRLDALCKEVKENTSTRATVILPNGKVVADSDEDPARMDNHGDRPEVKRALALETGRTTRYSHTLGKRMMYVAIALQTDGETAGVIRTALPIDPLDRELQGIYIQVAMGAGIAAVLAAAVSLLASRPVSRRLAELRRGAERFARGDLGHRLSAEHSEELALLAETMNKMAGELDARIHSLVRQHNEKEAVLSSMAEGVIAVDADEKVITLNHAASQLLKFSADHAQGRTIQEVVRNPELERLVRRALTGEEIVEGEILLPGEREAHLQANGTVLKDAGGRPIGALVVLNDVTRLRRLERMRTEFVANVSHELRTPVTSIKGFVETLLSEPPEKTGDARPFLEIIARQADRLASIIDDLLSLSRIEEDAQAAQIPLSAGPMCDALAAAVDACAEKAADKKIRVLQVCPKGLEGRINAVLLTQAVVNLIDNAIKYSAEGNDIEVAAEEQEGAVVVTVTDHGCGIAPEHLPHLFERFYRADKARSRKLGGTGLGLSIVKHIAQAHGGRVSVECAVGVGSVFRIHLPRP
ncbi:MAG: ATP-binding protein [Planctomycetota bacterium]